LFTEHPLLPFFPQKAKWLLLGSFPPGRKRWSMEFFYPNFQNDMWRIFGLIFFEDKNHFVNIQEKTFNKELITAFLTKQGVAVYDVAKTVIRHSGNASDKDLEIIEAVDVLKIIQELSYLQNIVATGQKALETIILQLAENCIEISHLKIGEYAQFVFENRTLRLYRMPSSSRAYPLALGEKADIYRKIFDEV
jgi:G:T/U-mismatch repair DNA glycosylase